MGEEYTWSSYHFDTDTISVEKITEKEYCSRMGMYFEYSKDPYINRALIYSLQKAWLQHEEHRSKREAENKTKNETTKVNEPHNN
jgi:hypothetical protein